MVKVEVELYEETVARWLEHSRKLDMSPDRVLGIMIEKSLEDDELTDEVEDPFFEAIRPNSLVYVVEA